MLSVLLSYLYIAITTFLLGMGIKIFAQKYLGYEMKEITSILYAGLGVATVYSGIYSLCSKVALGANLGMLLMCVVIVIWGKKELLKFLQKIHENTTKGKYFLVVIFLLVFSYGASRGYLHFDSGLYHAQAIRWIEEYGVVPGLANLHCRLAYNSSAFTLTALYSMEFLVGQSLHTVAGFMAMVLCGKGFSVVQVFWRKKVKVSDFLKVAMLFYISIIYSEMMSPASDYFAMLFLFYIVLRWVELEEEGEKNIASYSLLCVLLAVTVTVKLSAAIMLLMVLKPAVILIKEKRYGQIALYLSMGIVAMFPYLARNIILSGWLVYPFPGIDLFSLDWKIPAGEAAYDAEEIKVYAKGMTDVLLKDISILEWLPKWFSALKGLEKIWVLSSVVSMMAGGLFALWVWIKKETKYKGLLFVEVVMIAGYLFWQIGTPLVRYGYIYILAFPFFTIGLWFVFLFEKRPKSYLLFVTLLLVFFGYKGGNLLQIIVDSAPQEYYVWQRDYETLDYDSYKIGETCFYVPLESGQIGYEKFPAAPYERYDVEMRGESLAEGFRRIQN
ncbi:MAG: hypothetical protein IKW30_10460 [Lachnospiraceae bacterium]|nr:hypothetical protein [Lachnospiraceae bacterium]